MMLGVVLTWMPPLWGMVSTKGRANRVFSHHCVSCEMQGGRSWDVPLSPLYQAAAILTLLPLH